MKPRHVVYLKHPANPADLENSLRDTVVSAERNTLIVYYSGIPFECPRAMLNAAAKIPANLGALVQVPRDTADNPHRQWNYCIQRA